MVETQDKALRRIGELREQCSLEQQAKAHLEAALRLEMDDQQCVIKTMKTKLSLLGENPEELVKNGKDNLINLSENNGPTDEGSGNLINIDDSSDSLPTENENRIVAGASIIINDTNEKIQKLEAQLAEEKLRYAELQKQLEFSNEKITDLIVREEENTILLAQNKLAIHSELENREKEMKTLKIDAVQSASEKECLNEIVTELREENSKSIAQVKELTEAKRLLEQQVDELRKLKTTSESEIKELQAKVIVLDSEKQTILSKTQLELEKFKARYDKLQQKNEQLEEISRTKAMETLEKVENELKHVKEAHAEVSKQLNEQISKTQKLEQQLQEALNEHREVTKKLLSDADAARADKMKLEGRFKQIFEEKQILNSQMDEQVRRANSLAEELKNVKMVGENSESEAITKLQESMKSSIDELNGRLSDALKEKDDSAAEASNLKSKIDTLKNEKRDLEKTLEKEIRDKTELQTQVTNILQEIGRLEDQLKEVRQAYAELEQEKISLQEKTVHKEQAQQATKKLKDFETRLHDSENRNTQLIEEKRLLEENVQRLETIEIELQEKLKHENQQVRELNDRWAAAQLELESIHQENVRLQEKLKQSLDDYAELFNTKEQMDQEHRSLLDNIEAKEKEKLCLESDLTKLRSELEASQQSNNEKSNLTSTCDSLRRELDKMRNENEVLRSNKGDLEQRIANLSSDLSIMVDAKEKLEIEVIELKTQKAEVEEILNSSMDEKEQLEESLNERNDGLDQVKIENEFLSKSVKQLEIDLNQSQNDNEANITEITDLREKLKSQQCELYVLTEEKSNRSNEETKINEKIEILQKSLEDSEKLKNSLSQQVAEQEEQIKALRLLNDELQRNYDLLNDKLEEKNTEWDKTIVEQNERYQKLQEEFERTQAIEGDEKARATEVEQKLQREIDSSRAIIGDLNTDLNEQSTKITAVEEENIRLKAQIDELKSKQPDNNRNDEVESLRKNNDKLQYELAETKRNFERETSDLRNEIDELMDNAKAYKEKQIELEQLSTNNEKLREEIVQLKDKVNNISIAKESSNVPIKKNTSIDSSNFSDTVDDDDESVDKLKKENEDLDVKLNTIMNEVQDVSNRNLFLEQKCENYLILEQSNERLKLQNAKLSRQLDETLVSNKKKIILK